MTQAVKNSPAELVTFETTRHTIMLWMFIPKNLAQMLTYSLDSRFRGNDDSVRSSVTLVPHPG